MEVPELVRKALEYRGFTVVSDSVMLVVRGVDGEYVVLLKHENDTPPIQIEGKKLVISLVDDAEPEGDIFWSRADFEAYIGQALLSEALGAENPVDLISSFEEAFTDNSEPIAARLPDSDVLGEEDGVIASIKETLPFHAIYFSLESDGATDAGIILVDATDGVPYRAGESLLSGREMTELGEERKEPTISPENANDIAIDYIVSLHSREVESTEEMGSVTVVEKKIIGPSLSDISSRYLGIIHIPVLVLEKEDLTEVIDASGIIGFRKHY